MKARELRRQGSSIREVAKILSVSRGSVSVWCRDIELNSEQIEQLKESDRRGAYKGGLVVKKKKDRRVADYMRKGCSCISELTDQELFLIGISLYWAEGCKSRNSERIIFSNSDAGMIRLWMRWLYECLGVSKQDVICRVGINHLHRSRIQEVEAYWSQLTDVPLSQFRLASFKKVTNSKVYENFFEHYGTLAVHVRRSTNIFYWMLGCIEGLGKAGLGDLVIK